METTLKTEITIDEICEGFVYNESEGSSSVDSGYFWSKQKEGKVELLA